MAPRSHALLNASGSHRWLHCTAAPLLEENFPDSTSVYAKEGTLAHELCELKLQKYTTAMAKSTYTRKFNKIKKDELWQPEMDDTSETYLEYVKCVMLGCTATPVVAIEKRVDFSRYVPDGFGTADCIILSGDILHIVDYKHGKGVVVDAEHNPQMMLYALGAIDAYRLLYMFNTVKMTIVQPRVNNISEWEIPTAELLDWGNTFVKPRADEAISGNGKFEPGDWCRFCRAKQQCKARYEANDSLHSALVANHDPRLISMTELGEYLRRGKDVAAWLEDMKDYALTESLNGVTVPGWKAVEGRGSRAFQDTDAAIDTLIKAGIDESILYERKTLTLAQMEKTIGKTQFNDMVGDMIVKKAGKPTLVEESDKRPRITNQPTAAQIFNVSNDNNGGN